MPNIAKSHVDDRSGVVFGIATALRTLGRYCVVASRLCRVQICLPSGPWPGIVHFAADPAWSPSLVHSVDFCRNSVTVALAGDGHGDFGVFRRGTLRPVPAWIMACVRAYLNSMEPLL